VARVNIIILVNKINIVKIYGLTYLMSSAGTATGSNAVNASNHGRI
jgi:hypothetical protein